MSALLPDPLTLESIRLQRATCGCQPALTSTPTWWWLCDYHAGYDEGIERARGLWP